jgi:hypothetical protein
MLHVVSLYGHLVMVAKSSGSLHRLKNNIGIFEMLRSEFLP